MEEREFLMLADAELARIEAALEHALAADDADWDFELKPGGIIEIACDDDSKIIINRHAAAREIWLAARSGGFHFRPASDATGRWTDTRDGRDLATVLSDCLSRQAGAPTSVDW